MVKTLRKGFLAVVLAVAALFTLASCVIGGTTPTPTPDKTQEAQTALNDFTANVTFGNTDAVTTSFNLPIAGKKGGFNIPITWTSSNADVIAIADLMENGAPSTYYKQAKVTRPAFDQEDATVTLTADFSLTYTKADGTSATLKAQKTYTFVVLKETSEIASGNLAAIKAAAAKFYFEENGVAAGSSSPKELEFPVEFDATVTAVLAAEGTGQFTVSDGSAGIYVYSNKTAVKVGDKVHVKGSITTYYGTLQVGANIEVTVLGDSDQTVEFKPTTPGAINAISTADGMFGGQTVNVAGKLLYGKYNGGSNDSFWLEDVQTGSQIEIYYKSYSAEEKTMLQGFVGKYVEMNAVTYDTYSSSAPNDHRIFAVASTIKEATAPEVSDADKLAAAVNKVKAVSLAALYANGQEFAFPAVDGGEGVTITWAMDPATLLVDGKLVVTENGTAKLIATVVVGELSETVELTINVAVELKEEPAVTKKTIAELIALTTEMDAKYTVTGKVVKWGNKLDSTDTAATMYGNFILEDAEGKQIIVYGATATASALTFDAATGKYTYKNAKDFLTNALTKDIAVGDTVELVVVRTSYNNNPQLNAIVTKVTKPGETELPSEGVVTLAQAIEIANKQAHNTYTTGKFTVTGTVNDLYNTVYGNMHLIDADGNDLTIYGLYIEGKKYGDYTGTKPVAGDVITVTGVLGTYNGKPQMKNADLVIETTPEEPKHEHTACPTCGKCTAADCDGAEADKCAGHEVTPEVPGENTTVSVVIKDYAAANGWVNGTMYNTLVMDSKVTVTMSAKGGSGSYDPNTGKYYTSGFEWRAYQSDKEATIVVSAAEGLNIVSVKISYNSNKNGVLVCNGTNVETNTVVEVNGSSVTFSVGNTGTATNGQAKVTAIEVVYGAGSGSTPEQPDVPTHEHTLCPTCGKCTAADCDGTDKCEGHEVTPELPTEGVVTLAQAIEIANKQAHNTYTTGKFTVTGTVNDLYNTVYGNMHLIDADGNDLTIYGLYIEGKKYGDYTGTKPVAGDVITVTGVLGTYNGKPQMKNADLVIETTPEEHKHTEEVLPAVAATCYTTGLTEGKKCSECNEILVAQEEVPATGEHVDTNLDITCDTEGCTKRILPAADSKISLFTAKHMIIVSLSSSYYVEGVVTEMFDAKNGIFAITDEVGDTILVRLPKNAEGTAYTSWANKVVVGDTVQVYGKPSRNTSSTYPQEAKIEGGVLTVLKHEHKFSEATCKVPATCECLAVNGEALGHTDENKDNACDRCTFNMSWKESYIVIATDPSANGVLTEDKTSWTWSNEEFDAVIAKGTSTVTLYTTAKAYMQLKKQNTLTVASKNGATIVSVKIYVTNATQLTNLENGLTGVTFTKDEANLCVTVEWNKAENFVITNNGTTTAYVSGVEVVYEPKAAEPVLPEGTLLVDPSNTNAYATLDEAIAAAEPGNTIKLVAGEYTLSAVINKKLTIVGPNADLAVADFKEEEAVITVTKDVAGNLAADVVFNGVHLKGSGKANNAGVYFQGGGAATATLKSCEISEMNTLFKIQSGNPMEQITIENCHIHTIGQFIVWTYANAVTGKVTLVGNYVEGGTCGTIENNAAALFRVRGGSLEAYNNYFKGDSGNTSGYFEALSDSVVKYNTFDGVTLYVKQDAANKLVFDKNLYLNASGEALTASPITGATADTTVATTAEEVAKFYEDSLKPHEHTLCETCGKCTAADCDGTDKCEGHEVALEKVTYTYTFTASQFTANGTKKLNDVNWTISGDGGYWGFDSSNGRGQQLGSSGKPYKTLTVVSDEFTNVSKLVINTCGASSIAGTCKVYVGETLVGTITLTKTATDYSFELETPVTGVVKLEYTQTSSKAIYIKDLTVEYAK